MRLDLFLKTSRLVLRRNLAQEFCDAGLVRVNGSLSKSSKEIKPEDVVEVRRPNRIMKVRVIRIPGTKQVSKASASELFEVLEDSQIENDPLN